MTTATLAILTPTNTMIILVILLLMFGAKKLPELARGMGQAMKEFQKAKNDVHDEIMRDPAPSSQVVNQPPQLQQPPVYQQPPVQPAPAPGTYAQNVDPAHQQYQQVPQQPYPPQPQVPPTQPGTHA